MASSRESLRTGRSIASSRSRSLIRRVGVGLGLASLLLVVGAVAPATAADQAPTTTTLTASPNPVQVALPLTLTITVRGGTTTPTGGVDIIDVDTEDTVGSAHLDSRGVATIITANIIPPSQSHLLDARYFGDATHASSETESRVQIDPAPLGNAHVSGGGRLSLNGMPTNFDLDVYSNGTAAGGECGFVSDSFRITCTGLSDFHRTGNTVSLHGTGLYNRVQPISFSASITDGNPGSLTIYCAGQTYTGSVPAGEIVVANN